jgi:Molybdenum cofactor biosynthesis enzyme
MLEDSFGREMSGVRVSLTDRCNFDCVYCHNEGLGDTRGPMDPQDNEMDTDDVVRFLEVAAEFDVDSVKFTGGEPMLRDDLEEIIARTPESMEVSMTTNGTFLPGRAGGLVEAGLDRVTSHRTPSTRRSSPRSPSPGLRRSDGRGSGGGRRGLTPVKINMVVFELTAGYVPEMVDFVAENRGLQLQLIEYMPEIAGHPEWAIDIQRVHDWLDEQAERVETREMHDRNRYYVNGGVGENGETPSVTSRDSSGVETGMVEIVDPVENEDFCANCGRVRVTHEGYLKGCLNRNDDLRSMGEMTRPEIREAYRDVVDSRVPYYGEYLVENDDGNYVINEKYIDVPEPDADVSATNP